MPVKGSAVGAMLGAAVGDSEILRLGSLVGASEGANDGNGVGHGVGGCVKTSRFGSDVVVWVSDAHDFDRSPQRRSEKCRHWAHAIEITGLTNRYDERSAR